MAAVLSYNPAMVAKLGSFRLVYYIHPIGKELRILGSIFALSTINGVTRLRYDEAEVTKRPFLILQILNR